MLDKHLGDLKELPIKRRDIKHRLRRAERVTLKHAHRFVIKRLANLRDVQRHALGWMVLLGLLITVTWLQIAYMQNKVTVPGPAEGGVFSEGVLGTMDTINPIFVSSQAEKSGSRLVFASLLSYDEKGDLVGELAKSWSVDKSGKNYTLDLRDARWSDGVPITASDVVYTIDTIKNVDTRSPLYTSWRNISVSAVNPKRVKFVLPSSYAAFPNSLTLGILPRHILGTVNPHELRTHKFNRQPEVSSGAFIFSDLHTIDINKGYYLLEMRANPDFVLGKPKLDGFNLHAFNDSEELVKSFRTRGVAAASGLHTDDLNSLRGMQYEQIDAPLFNGVYAFFNTAAPLTKDKKIRQALAAATDQKALIDALQGRVEPLDGPLLPGQVGYKDKNQKAPNLKRARQLLDSAKWVADENGKRFKGKTPLKLSIRTVSANDYSVVINELIKQWSVLGIEFDSQVVRPEDAQQSVISPRAYDILIYEIAIGRDPDVYAFWHSSQATERGLNLSNYRSPISDDALATARSAANDRLRAVKYSNFVNEWHQDQPAIPLYRPALTYVQSGKVFTFGAHPVVGAPSRYANVLYWAATSQDLRPTR